jgi:hypothetical protein
MNRYHQVLRTYWHRWLFWILAVPSLAVAVPMLIWPPDKKYMALTMVVPMTALGAWWAASVTAHLKEQLADTRAILLPHFTAPHVLVAVVAMAVINLLIPAGLARGPYLSPLGVAAVVGLASVLTAWLAYLQSVSATGIWIGLCLLLLSRTVRLELNDVLLGISPIAPWILLALAIVLLAGLILRMLLLDEEKPEYSRQPVMMWSLKPAMTGDRSLRLAAAEAHWLNAALAHRAYKLARLRNIYDAGFWKRVRHWRLVTGPGWTPWIVAMALGAWASIMPYFESTRNRMPLPEAVAILCMFLPIPFVAFGWMRRWHSLGYELMRPCTRRGMFLEVGAAMLLDLVETVVALSVGGAIPMLTWQPDAVLQVVLSPFYLVVLAAHLVLFGFLMWVILLRIGWLSAISILLAPFGVAIITGAFFWISAWIILTRYDAAINNNPGAYAAVPIWLLAVVVLAAALLISSAYGAWCEADLD